MVILSPDNPLNLGVLTREIVAAREGMLVDQYFDDQRVGWLADATSIARVLMSRSPDKGKSLAL